MEAPVSWHAGAERARRIAETMADLTTVIPELWRVDEHIDDSWYSAPPEMSAGYLAATCAHLRQRWPGEAAMRAAEVCLFPVERLRVAAESAVATDAPLTVRARQHAIDEIIESVCAQCCVEMADPAVVALMQQRMAYLASRPFAADPPEGKEHGQTPSFHAPSLHALIAYLLECGRDDATAAVVALVEGRWNVTVTPSPDQAQRLGTRPFGSYRVWHGALALANAESMWSVLIERGAVDYATFASFYRTLVPPVYSYLRIDEPGDAIDEWLARLAWDLAHSDDPADWELLAASFRRVHGDRFVLRAAELIDGVGRDPVDGVFRDKQQLSDGLARMARGGRRDGEHSDEVVAAELARFTSETLQVLALYSARLRQVISTILQERGDLDPVPLCRLADAVAADFADEFGDAESNNPDATKGVLDVTAIAPVLGAYAPAIGRQLLKRMAQINPGWKPAGVLLGAAAGWEKAEALEKRMAKRNQISTRAFGLSPLPAGRSGEQECLRRYLAVREWRQGSRKFGQQRRANEAAAADACLANLANTAGLGDPHRLEWRMESLLIEQDGVETALTIEPYAVELVCDEGGVAQVRVSKNGKALKTLPAALRKDPAVQALTERAKLIRDQGKRFRRSLERLCENGAALAAEDLRAIAALPAARSLLDTIVVQDARDRFGMYRGEGELAGIDGAIFAPAMPLRVAHPYDLFGAGVLSAWQAFVVAERIVQPFKQVFRELYVPTPVERTGDGESLRFNGHPVRSDIASGLLATRGWVQRSGDYAETVKLYPQHGLEAEITWQDAGHFLTEDACVTMRGVRFRPYPERDWDTPPVPVDTVPPRVFSEVMRDADLIAAVGQVDGVGWVSSEMVLRRGEMIAQLLDALGLPGVERRGNFAHVKGSRANYRVHLGSGAIHIEPGSYLCIVPERRSIEAAPSYLPFAAGDDLPLAEIISKVLLLMNDAEITDQTILEQIEAAVS